MDDPESGDPPRLSVPGPDLPESFAMVIARKPMSKNAGGKARYESEIRAEAEARFTGSRLPGDLFARIYWFHRDKIHGKDGDADNISKPILDALSSVIYRDDVQVVKRLVQKVFTGAEYTLDDRACDPVTFAELARLLAEEHAHIISIEVGRLRAPPRIVFGPIEEGEG